MDGQSEKGKEVKTLTRQILDKVETLESRIGVIESSLKRIGESSFLTTEDQFFFGFVFALLLFSLTLPELDVGTLFESFGVEIETTKGIITTNVAFVIFLILAAGARYLTAFAKEETKRNRWRIVSVALLLSSFYLLIVELLIRGLANLLLKIHVFLIFLAPVALTLISIVIGILVEKRWYLIYDCDEPYMSKIFGYVGLGIIVAYYIAMIVGLFAEIPYVVAVLIVLSSFGIILLIRRFVRTKITAKRP